MKDFPQESKTKPETGRNRTLSVPEARMEELRREIFFPEHPLTAKTLHDRILCGDMRKLIELLPDAFVDLMILDPPYNLSKDFHGLTFSRTSDSDYLAYLRSWFPQLLRLLKPGASVYLCGDWSCSAADYQVLTEHLTVRNRIVWQTSWMRL